MKDEKVTILIESLDKAIMLEVEIKDDKMDLSMNFGEGGSNDHKNTLRGALASLILDKLTEE